MGIMDLIKWRRIRAAASGLVWEARIRWARACFLLREFAPDRVSTATVARLAFLLIGVAGVRTRPVVLVQVTQTSADCLAQWDGWDRNGSYYYLRYRDGAGKVCRYRTPDWPRADRDELIRVVATFDDAGPHDGVISLEAFAARAGITVASGAAVTGFWDHVRDELVMRGATRLLGEGEV
jgi:hypothetical protein